MKNFWLILSVLWLWTCSEGGGDKTTGPEKPPIVVNLTSLGGATSIQFGSNSTGIAITGSTQSSSGDWDGFILLLDSDGNRIY